MNWLSIFWVFSHFLSAIAIFIGMHRRFPVAFIILGIQLLIFSLKAISYDLVYYLENFSNPSDSFEIGFNLLTLFLNLISGGNPYFSLWLVQIGGAAFFIYLLATAHNRTVKIKFTSLDWFSTAVAFSLTLFYFMGSQNVLRQFLATMLVGYSGLLMYHNRKTKAFLLMILAVTVHFGTIIFVVISLAAVLLLRCHYAVSIPAFMIGGTLMTLFLKIIAPDLEYLIIDFATGDERTGGSTKAIVYFLFLLISYAIIAGSREKFEVVISTVIKLRFFLFFFALPFAIFNLDEFYSRIIFPLFFLDSILICRSFIHGSSDRYNYSSSFLLFSYAFAPNVHNLLSVLDA